MTATEEQWFVKRVDPEAPGKHEVEEGHPFVGNAGKLLEEVGIDRSKLYVTNIVKIRPTKESGGSTQNRPPRAGDLEGAPLSKLLRLSSRSAGACTNGAVVATDSASANAD